MDIQIKHLLVDVAIMFLIIVAERRIILNGEHVHIPPASEVEVEIRLVEVERSVVENPIDVRDRIKYAVGAVSEGGVKLTLPGAAGDE